MIFHESGQLNNCFKHAPKWMVSSLIFQKFSGEGLTEPPLQTPLPAFSRASPSVRALPSIFGRFAPSTRASPSILGRFAPSIRASPSTFDWGPWFGPPKINSWIRPCDWSRTVGTGGAWRFIENRETQSINALPPASPRKRSRRPQRWAP